MDDNSNYLPQVRNQYEDYPYPPRYPEDERHRLLRTGLCELPQINHYGHRGRQDFRGYQALVAGAGTGDATIFLAEQLQHRGGHVTSLDMSLASTEVAKQRAEVRGLTNITWLHASLLDLPDMDIGPFDHINCSGVLHHLTDPDQGLAALKSVLKPDGSMGIMLYARYAREGVYQMQALMRYINHGETDMDACVRNANATLKAIPDTNWYKHGEGFFSDIWKFGDPGVYDLLLHSQDRAYTIPEIFEFVERQGLHFVQWGRPFDRMTLTPEFVLREPRLLQRLGKLPERDRQAVMEILTGCVIKHSFYVSAVGDSVARLDDLDNVPYLYGFAGEAPHQVIADGLQQAKGKLVSLQDEGFSYMVPSGKMDHHLLRATDGKNTTGQIFEAVRQATGKAIPDKMLLKEFTGLFEAFNKVDHMLLRHHSAEPMPPIIQPGETPPA